MNNDSHILVSIIVPVYNVEKYISRCIDSIIAQTYSNIEIILIDDGSTDESGLICDRYKEKDPRIISIHQANGGISSVRNKGLDIAKGEYYLFVDSDDLIHPRYTEALLTAAIENNCKIAQCEYQNFSDEKGVSFSDDNKLKKVNIKSGREMCRSIYEEHGVSATVVWTKIYHKSLWEKKRFEGMIHEDMLINYEMLYLSETIALIDEELYFYRRTPNSLMNTAFSADRLFFFEVLEKQLVFFGARNDAELFKGCIMLYVNTLLLYTYMVYKRAKSGKKQLLDQMYRLMKRAKSLCKDNRIRVPVKCRLYLILPRGTATVYTMKYKIKRKSGKLIAIVRRRLNLLGKGINYAI